MQLMQTVEKVNRINVASLVVTRSYFLVNHDFFLKLSIAFAWIKEGYRRLFSITRAIAFVILTS